MTRQLSDTLLSPVARCDLARVAGLLSLTTAKSGALIGVLISVTTIPAAANVGVAAAYGDWSEFRGALAQLALNLTCLSAVGICNARFAAGILQPPTQAALCASRLGSPRRPLGPRAAPNSARAWERWAL